MNYCVVVQARGKELDYLRGEAYRVARDASTDWYAEPRDLDTAFCFENANVAGPHLSGRKLTSSRPLP